jgi:hypothetical protein
VSVQQPEQLYQGEGRLGPAILVSRESIDSTPKEFGGFALIEVEFLADRGNENGIDGCGIHLPSELADQVAVSVTMLAVQDDLAARWAKVSRHRRDGSGFALVGVGDVAGVADQVRCATIWTFHGYNSLKETINTSSMTVSFK